MLHRFLAAFVGVCAATITLAQAPDAPLPPDVYRTGHGVMAPQVLEKTDPEYSEEARALGLQGTVMLSMIVDASGLPRDVLVTNPIGLGLDEKAIAAVSKWRFQPGTKDGQPVAVMVTIEVNFRLLAHKSGWRLERADFRTPAGASRPAFDHVDLPPAGAQSEFTTVSMSFEVGADGVPVNLHVRNSSDADAEKLINRDGPRLAIPARHERQNSHRCSRPVRFCTLQPLIPGSFAERWPQIYPFCRQRFGQSCRHVVWW